MVVYCGGKNSSVSCGGRRSKVYYGGRTRVCVSQVVATFVLTLV